MNGQRGKQKAREANMFFFWFAWSELKEDKQYLLPHLLCRVFLKLISD